MVTSSERGPLSRQAAEGGTDSDERMVSTTGKSRKDITAKDMYLYFSGYNDKTGAPSFAKFAKMRGITVAELEKLRDDKNFDAAYRECGEIRRDYLIDHALDKRFDPSFVKFIITAEDGGMTDDCDDSISLKLEVLP